ncbi:glycoside hydrolase family protein [Candidatus Sumerlaeota bacterium]
MTRPMIDRLLPIPRDSGFRQHGHFVWCGSMIRVDDRYHLFASRWPEGTGDPGDLVGILDGYRQHSQIVRATSDNPIGPYTFQDVVLAGRGEGYWDGQSCHGPKIVRLDEIFVLYYQAIACNSRLRKIGYAWAAKIEGPWHRCEREIPLTEDANNPAPCIRPDGSVLLAFRTRNLAMHVARADAFDGDYATVAENIFPAGQLEDPDLYFADGKYHMIMEDNQGVLTGSVRHGGHLVSVDGIRWTPHDPTKVYPHDLGWTDGTSWTATRRERPDMFNDLDGVKGSGNPTHLITGVLYQGHSWCVVQAIAPA